MPPPSRQARETRCRVAPWNALLLVSTLLIGVTPVTAEALLIYECTKGALGDARQSVTLWRLATGRGGGSIARRQVPRVQASDVGKHHFPVARAPDAYHGTGTTLMLGALALWIVATVAATGDPRPLPYVPPLNPLELTQLGILLVIGLRLRESKHPVLRTGVFALGVGAFVWINFVTARAIHHLAGVAFPVWHVFRSDSFQTTASILWTSLALVLMGFATRRGQRGVWIAGAILLGLVIAKLFTIDISRLDLLARIISFVVVGILMLVIGFLTPLPPARRAHH